MPTPRDRTDDTPRIQTPCAKRWDELEREPGSSGRRYCHECRLHVHDGSSMTREQARELVRGATERVCMRFELDERGEPRFEQPVAAALDLAGAWQRVARWTASAAVGALAACSGSDSSAPNPGAGEPPSKLGKVCAPEIVGDVASPRAPDEPPAAPPVDVPMEWLGEVCAPTDAASSSPGETPRRQDPTPDETPRRDAR